MNIKYLAYGVSGVVAIAIITGFFLVGSPFEARTRKFDDQRVSNLQSIQNEIINYWINKNALPENLSQIRDDIRGIVIPKDPETGTEYEYVRRGELAFSLCATFSRPSTVQNSSLPKPAYDPYTGNWDHKEGHVCFERTIDPDIYQPKTKTPAND